ncbi:MAG TPA: rod shape-determining protein RodA [Candidatus Acidoferrales bacterium]|nr:rod shape-determining protein RodA [Candidatus Acidoferrales bacterium]
MQIDRRLIAHFDWTLLSLGLSLALIGLVTIYSATYNFSEGQAGGQAIKQAYWIVIGAAAMIVFFTVDYHVIDRIAYPFYALVLLLLVVVHFVGASGGGSQRWIHFGFFALQPSELSKLAIAWVLAAHLKYDEPVNGFCLRDLGGPFLLLFPLVGLVLIQPDLGTAVLILLVFFSVIIVGGLRLKSLMWLVAGGVTLLPVGWNFLKPYQRNRIFTFLNPDVDPLGTGYHVIQSKIAVGSGRWFGKGYLNGTQNRLDFLPAQHTDFIFSVFSEEWGFVGCAVLLAIYFAFLYCCLHVVARAKDRFGALLAFGMTAIFLWQIVINIAMVTGVLPVVGIPLPLLSYGGSSLVSMMIALGLLINVSMRRFTF